jgi:hypothetical protein
MLPNGNLWQPTGGERLVTPLDDIPAGHRYGAERHNRVDITN